MHLNELQIFPPKEERRTENDKVGITWGLHTERETAVCFQALCSSGYHCSMPEMTSAGMAYFELLSHFAPKLHLFCPLCSLPF